MNDTAIVVAEDGSEQVVTRNPITDLVGKAKTNFIELSNEPRWKSECSFAMQIFNKNNYLAGIALQNPKSVYDAMLNVANIGLSLNPAKSHAYLIPRKVNKVMHVLLEVSYMGMVEILVANNVVDWVKADVIRENDVFKLGERIDQAPIYQPNGKCDNIFAEDRGKPLGVFSCVKLKNGDYNTELIWWDEIMTIRDSSESYKRDMRENTRYSPWLKHEFEMAKKTAVRRHYKLLPKSSTHIPPQVHKALDVAIESIDNDYDFTPKEATGILDHSELNQDILVQIAASYHGSDLHKYVVKDLCRENPDEYIQANHDWKGSIKRGFKAKEQDKQKLQAEAGENIYNEIVSACQKEDESGVIELILDESDEVLNLTYDMLQRHAAEQSDFFKNCRDSITSELAGQEG